MTSPRGRPVSRATTAILEEAAAKADEAAAASEEVPPVDEYFGIPYIARVERAGFGTFEAEKTGVVPTAEFENFDFRTPDDESVPRHIRNMTYAELETAIRSMYFPEEVVTVTVVQKAFELPPKHRLSGAAMQALMHALTEAQSGRGDVPDWKDFADINPQPAPEVEEDAEESTPDTTVGDLEKDGG